MIPPRATIALALCAGLAAAGCSSLSPQQGHALRAWTAKGYKVQVRDEEQAMWLGFLPGGGSFYLGDYAQATADLFLWPLSIAWDPLLARSGAEERNYWATAQSVEQQKQRDLRGLEERRALGRAVPQEYVDERRRIDDQYGAE